jgi:hypothetical protein
VAGAVEDAEFSQYQEGDRVIMAKWIINDLANKPRLAIMPRPSIEYLHKVITQNNKTFAVYKDDYGVDVIIECENKPGDLPIYGITFESPPNMRR